MDFRNQVGIDIFGSEIGSDLERTGGRLHDTPTKGSQEYPGGGG